MPDTSEQVQRLAEAIETAADEKEILLIERKIQSLQNLTSNN
jgi:hypothetical protein